MAPRVARRRSTASRHAFPEVNGDDTDPVCSWWRPGLRCSVVAQRGMRSSEKLTKGVRYVQDWQDRESLPPGGNVGTALHLAHGDRGSITTRLLGRRRQVGEWDAGHPVGVQGERG